MTAFVWSLNVLRDNVRAEVRFVLDRCGMPDCSMCQACRRLLEQLDSDVRECRADFEQVLATGEGW